MTLQERTQAVLAKFREQDAPPPNAALRQLGNSQSKVQAALSPTDHGHAKTAIEGKVAAQAREAVNSMAKQGLAPSNDNTIQKAQTPNMPTRGKGMER